MKNKKGYICPECKLKYLNKEWADKCEAWCKKTNSCNLEITEHALSESKSERASKTNLGTIVGSITVIWVLLCPICYALPLLLAFGLGSLVTPFAEYGHWFVTGLIALSIYSFYKNSLVHKNMLPLWVGLISLAIFLVGKMILDVIWATYTAGGLILIATVLDYKMKKDCNICK